jgi:AcrR family transcriptional regulator
MNQVGDPLDADAQDQKSPRTARGRRTRDALLDAARDVFARDGFFNAKITDMTGAASLANGTFYTYFSSKEGIFREVARAVLDESLETIHGHPDNPERDPLKDILWANERYLRYYQGHAGLMGAIEQATPHDPYIRDLRYASFMVSVRRTEQRIRLLQGWGLADRDMDPSATSLALCAMVLRVAYTMFVLQEPVDLDLAVLTTTKIWAKALGLDARSLGAGAAPPMEREGRGGGDAGSGCGRGARDPLR